MANLCVIDSRILSGCMFYVQSHDTNVSPFVSMQGQAITNRVV